MTKVQPIAFECNRGKANMKSLASLSVILLVGGPPTVALAQVTQSYSYDANGRLTGVSTTGPGGTNTAAYVYDDANNRVSRTQTGSTAYAAVSRLPIRSPLLPNEALVSPDGRFSFALRSSGRLELWEGNEIALDQPFDPSTAFIVAADGKALFFGVTAGSDAGVYLDDEGSLILVDAGGRSLWRSASTGEGVSR